LILVTIYIQEITEPSFLSGKVQVITLTIL
jgi:hypothetical protein